MNRLRKIGKRVIPILFWIGVWEAAYYLVHKDLLLASPVQVFRRLGMVTEAAFWKTVGTTLLRGAEAWLAGILAGGALALLCHASKVADMLAQPMIGMIRATPVASFIILALVWLGASEVPVMAGLFMVLPIAFAHVTEGLRGIDPQTKEMMTVFRYSRWKRFTAVSLPSLLPGLTAACETGVGLCFKATVAAEVIGAPADAIGSMLRNAKVYMETDALIAWTLVVILLSVALEKLVGFLLRKGFSYAYHT